MTPYKETSLLYRPELIQANLESRKNHTRRLKGLHHVNEIPNALELRVANGIAEVYMEQESDPIYKINSPFGKAGDLLYIKEPHYVLGYWEVTKEYTKKGAPKWKFIRSADHEPRYMGDEPPSFQTSIDRSGQIGWYRRTPLFMPKSYARQWMIIESIGAERLKDISEEDAIQEGVESKKRFHDSPHLASNPVQVFRNYEKSHINTELDYSSVPTHGFPFFYNAISSFETLINSIHGDSIWKQNPWVWVIKYRALSFDGRPSEYTIKTAREELFESLS